MSDVLIKFITKIQSLKWLKQDWKQKLLWIILRHYNQEICKTVWIFGIKGISEICTQCGMNMKQKYKEVYVWFALTHVYRLLQWFLDTVCQLGLHSDLFSTTSNPSISDFFVTPHAHARATGYVIGAGVHIYIIYICICYSTGRSDIRDIFHEL